MGKRKYFRVGLVGAGMISEFHIRSLLRLPSVQIVGITDQDSERAKEMAARFRILDYPSLEALATAGLDVVHVMTPPSSHAELTLRGIALGCHVFVEKPLATSIEDCDRVIVAAKVAGKLVGVNHSLLFDPFVERLLHLVRIGAVGEVRAVDYSKSQNYPTWREGPLPVPYREGGYPFRDVGVHGLYLMQELLGNIVDVRVTFRPGDDPSLMFSEWRALVECQRGTGQMHLSWNIRPMSHVLIVQGTKGVIRADMFGMTIGMKKTRPLPEFLNRSVNAWLESASATIQVPINLARVICKRIHRFHGVQAMVADFYKRLEVGQMPAVTPEQARLIVEWTESIACQADDAKKACLAQFPQTLTSSVLVTGATGFIGRHLLARLLSTGRRIRILVRRKPPRELLENAQIEIVIGDLGDQSAVDRAVEGTEIVYHLGATMQGDADAFHRGTVTGTRNVIESVLKHRVPKLVYVSSLSVLHATAKGSKKGVSEDWPLEPAPVRRGNYTQTKLKAEQLVTEAVRDRGLPAVILRPGMVFGPGAPLLTPAVARRKKNRLLVLGSGKVPLPLVYVEDLVDGIIQAVERPVFDGSVFHLVDSFRLTQNELIDHYVRASGDNLKVRHLPYPIVWALAFSVQTASGLLRRPAPLSVYRVKSCSCEAAVFFLPR